MSDKKKNKKAKLKENIIDLLLELVLSAIFFAVGFGVLSLFGVRLDDMDADLTVLLGIAVTALIIGGAVLAVRLLNKNKKNKDKEV